MGEIWVVGVKSFLFVKIAKKKKKLFYGKNFPYFAQEMQFLEV